MGFCMQGNKYNKLCIIIYFEIYTIDFIFIN